MGRTMVNFSARASLAAAVALALGACGGDPAPEPPTGALGAALGGPDCPTVLCGDNNGVGNVPIHELDASMTSPNAAGIRIVAFKSPKYGDMKPRVEGDRLIGETWSEGDLEGKDLIGSWFTLVNDKAGLEGRLVIEGVGAIDYKIAPDPSRPVPLYHFVYYPEGREGAPTELCRNTLIDPEYGNIEGSAIIFSGDRYDTATLKVYETGPGDPWFNIGCPGTGAMKMHLFRHTRAGSGEGEYKTDVSQRQALLRMFGADYCGRGKNFTVDGQKIAFNFDQKWLPEEWAIDVNGPEYKSPEAIWRADGAYCLVMPRRFGATPGIWSDILSECHAAGRHLDPCKPDELETWSKYGYALTMNPAQQ
jgi:hypothetical protein